VIWGSKSGSKSKIVKNGQNNLKKSQKILKNRYFYKNIFSVMSRTFSPRFGQFPAQNPKLSKMVKKI